MVSLATLFEETNLTLFEFQLPKTKGVIEELMSQAQQWAITISIRNIADKYQKYVHDMSLVSN